MSAITSRRVLLVLESWGDGGTEAYVGQLGLWLARRGWEPALCLLGGAPADLGEQIGGWARNVHVLGARGTMARAVGLRRLLRRERPAVCHLHIYSSLLPAVLTARAVPQVRVVSTLHTTLWQWNLRHRIGWRVAVALSHAVTGVSEGVLASIGRRAGDRTWLTPPPFPPSVVAQAPEAGGPPDSRRSSLRIVGAGRLAPEKDWPTLLRAVSIVAARLTSPPRLKLFGGGPLEHELREAARDLGIEGITEFVGNVARDRLLRELREADVFVLPSRFEGLPMGAMEAMAVGAPTIVADFDTSAELVEHGITGHRFPRGDVLALADLLEWHYHNPQEAHRLADVGRASVLDRFHEDAVFAGFEAAYVAALRS